MLVHRWLTINIFSCFFHHCSLPYVTCCVQSITGNTEYIVIDEFESDVFRQLVEYIHTGQVVLQARTLLGKYQTYIFRIVSYFTLIIFYLLSVGVPFSDTSDKRKL